MGRKKKEIRLKEPVRIREKKIAGGNISLYLDIYQKGLRKKETLKLYLVPEINAATKLQNANTRKLAEQIKAQRILDIQREGLVDWDKVKKSRMTLTKWMDDFVKYNAELSESSMKTKRNTHARIDQYLLYIGKPEFLLKDVDKEFWVISLLRKGYSIRDVAKLSGKGVSTVQLVKRLIKVQSPQ